MPDFLWGQFLGQLQMDEATLRAFCEHTMARLPDGPVGDDPVKFWRAAIATAFPSGAPKAPILPLKTQANLAAGDAWLASRRPGREGA